MKGASISAVLWISLTIGCSCRQETRLPAPNAPEAPTFEPQAKKAAEPAAPKPLKPPPLAPPPLSAFPASREPPIHGLALEIKISAPEVSKETAQPSPPREEKKAKP